MEECEKVALFLNCDMAELTWVSIEKETKQTDEWDMEDFEEEKAGTEDCKLMIFCASSAFYDYKNMCSPKLS